MKLPQLNEIAHTIDMIDVFSGYNHNYRIGEGEFYDMKNLSSSSYPVIAPRGKRGVFKKDVPVQGIIAKDGICYISGGELCYHKTGEQYPLKTTKLGLSENADLQKTMMVSMGAYIIIIARDKDGEMLEAKYVNTSKTTFDGLECGNISVEQTINSVNMSLCDIDGKNLGIVSKKDDSGIKDGDIWIDTSKEPFVAYKYVAESQLWSQYDTYIRIEAEGIDTKFNVGDGVVIEYLKADNELPESFKNAPRGNVTIIGKGNNYIVIKGAIPDTITASHGTAIMRVAIVLPRMDFVIESGNRLWGCRYGLNNNGEMVNEIYASKLGDFKNWNSFQGISTDSYVVSVGTDGAFTGAVTHLGYPIFFKENCMHKIYGSYPSNYQVQTTACRGVQKGSEKSLAIVNEVLFYKSLNGICAFDGSLPTEISSSLGEVAYSKAVGGCLGNKYYVSMFDGNNYVLFVYDAARGIWHKEDDTQMVECASYMGNLYYIDGKDSTKIKTILKGSYEGENDVRWMAETGNIGTDSPFNKYISKLNIRLNLDVQASVVVYIRYNSMGDWQFVGKMIGSKLQSYTMPIKPRRCDHFQLRFEGNGDAKIFSICKTIEQGGEA